MENEPVVEIKEMPTKEMLEKFMGGLLGGQTCVIFDTKKGVFIDVKDV